MKKGKDIPSSIPKKVSNIEVDLLQLMGTILKSLF